MQKFQHDPLRPERLLYPNQIVTPDELQPGMVVEAVYSNGAVVRPVGVLAVGKAHDNGLTCGLSPLPIVEDNTHMILAEQRPDGRIVPRTHSMADMGLIPYDTANGPAWNSINYLRYLQTDTKY